MEFFLQWHAQDCLDGVEWAKHQRHTAQDDRRRSRYPRRLVRNWV